MRAAIAWLRARRPDDTDAGTSLMELTIGMTLMAVFMAIFTTAVVGMSNTASKVEAMSTSATQVNQAFLKLDKSVRYATAISTAGRSSTSGQWYVEFDTSNGSADTCTQLRVDATARQLQQRTWTAGGPTGPTPTAWSVLADGIVNGAAAVGSPDQPFAVPAATAGASTAFQQLAVTLAATSGTATAATARTTMSFTALNSKVAATTNATVCQQAGRP